MTLETSDTPPADWDALAGDRLFASSRWLRTLGGRFAGTHVYFVLRRSGVARVGCFATVIVDPHAYLPTNVFDVVVRRGLLGPGRDAGDGFPATTREQWAGTLAIAYPGYDTFVVAAPDVTAEEIEEFVAAVGEWGRTNDCAAVWWGYVASAGGSHTGSLTGALRARGFHRTLVAERSHLRVPPGGFDGYLAALRRPHRKKVRRELRLLREAGVRAETVDFGAYADRIVDLRVQHQRKYGHATTEAEECRRLWSLAQTWPNEITVVAALDADDDRMLAFSLLIRDGRRWIALLTGADDAHPRVALTYFLTTYYAPIRLAPEHGIADIDYGLGTADAKRRRGCAGTAVYSWMLRTGRSTGA